MIRSKIRGSETFNAPGLGVGSIAGSSTATFIGKAGGRGVATMAGVGAFAAVPKSPILDLLPAASVAYSFRRLLTSYTTNKAVRVRRSSDNTESDIGFDANGNFDVAAFNTFIGAGSGFVKTWYDQSGNGVNATQATAANQPQVVVAITALNSKVGALFHAGGPQALVVASGVHVDNPFAGGGTIAGVWNLVGG